MTVSSTIPFVSYAGNGATTLFTVPFSFVAAADLVVTEVVDATGVETIKTLTTHYTVAGGGGASGSITMLVAPASGVTLVIKRDTVIQQGTDYTQNDRLPAEQIEADMDYLVRIVQEIDRNIGTAIQAPSTFNPANPPLRLPTPEANKLLQGKADLTGWQNVAIADLALASIPVSLSGLASGDLLRYNGTLWENKTTPFALGGILTTRGDVIVRGATEAQRLALGTAGFEVASDGTDAVWRAPPLQSGNVQCPYENFVASRPSTSTVDIDADAVVLRNTSGGLKRFTALNETLSIAASGANGLDTGAEASNTWYHFWAIGKEDGTLDGLLSLSATAPTMPSGYTYKGYLGAVRNDGSSNFIDFAQVGNRVAFAGVNVLAAGTATAATSVSLASAVPPTAKAVVLTSALISTSGTQDSQVILAASSGGLGAAIVGGGTTAGSFNSYHTNEIVLVTAQTIWYNLNGANRQANLDVRGWGY